MRVTSSRALASLRRWLTNGTSSDPSRISIWSGVAFSVMATCPSFASRSRQILRCSRQTPCHVPLRTCLHWLREMTHLEATFRQPSAQEEVSARVAEVTLTFPRQRLGGEWMDAKNLRQRPVALTARWRSLPKLLATPPPDSVVGALPPRCRKKSRAPYPTQSRCASPYLVSTKCSPDPRGPHLQKSPRTFARQRLREST